MIKMNTFFKLTLVLFVSTINTTLFSQKKNWKTEALNRIDENRKQNINIHITDAAGRPIQGAAVQIKLTKHDFKFGAVVDAEFLNSKNSATYKDTFLKYFNAAGFENALKPKHRGTVTEAETEKIADWFEKNNIQMRGHALVYDGEKFLRQDVKKIIEDKSLNNQQKLQQALPLVDFHVKYGMNKWNVIAWDVLNEPIGNSIVDDLTPQNLIAYWFKLADKQRKAANKTNTKLYINENRIISGTTPNTFERPLQYKTIIQNCLKLGAPIEGIGFQSRFKDGYVKPAEMYKRLCSFDDLNLEYQGTEFEIRDSEKYTYSPEEIREITEQFMLIYLSHPKVTGIWHWTFNDTKDNAKPWALFNYDGSPTVCGKQWIQTMETYFNTNINTSSNDVGNVNSRGFKGDYLIEINYNGKNKTVQQTVLKDENINIVLE